MEFEFVVHTKLRLENTPPAQTSKHVKTEYLLDVSRNLDAKQYLSNGLPNKEGSRVVTDVLISGLIGNIHMMHQKDWRDSAEHLRYIIQRLEEGFIQQANIGKGKF